MCKTTKRSSIRSRLIEDFTVAILIPVLLTAAAGVWMIRERVYAQAQVQVNSNLQAARVIYLNRLERLRGAMRIHATRMVIYGALAAKDSSGVREEMERIRQAEQLDILTLIDASGRVFYRANNPRQTDDSQVWQNAAVRALRDLKSTSGTMIVSGEDLAKESPALAEQASMQLTPTPRARSTAQARLSSGMMLHAVAPVLTPAGKTLGVLCAGVLLNRNYDLVDGIRETVFDKEQYEGRDIGSVTIFQGDVRISTNAKNGDGTRAVATQVSAEVADHVLGSGGVWRGRAFVVNEWYVTAYEPIADVDGKTIGMLSLGVLERPYYDALRRSLYVFLGIAVLAVVFVSVVAIKVAGRISRPISAMADAARWVAQGDYSRKVREDVGGELGYLAASFNTMTSELARVHNELREWTETLERKVEQRTGQLRSMQTQLLQTEKMAAIGKLAAGVAHEINNPLTGVLTYSSLMLRDLTDDDPRREELQTIVDETLRCRTIVKGLLDFARQTKPHKQALSLNKVIDNVLSLVRNQAIFRNIAIRTDLDPDPPVLMADADQMRQVVLNVVLNAAEAMPQGGELRILSRFDKQSNSARLQIADTGPGIPDDIKDKIFEPFFTTKKSGTGLGLAIAYGIVERHRGTLSLDSVVGRGTTFSMSLPVDGAGTDD